MIYYQKIVYLLCCDTLLCYAICPNNQEVPKKPVLHQSLLQNRSLLFLIHSHSLHFLGFTYSAFLPNVETAIYLAFLPNAGTLFIQLFFQLSEQLFTGFIFQIPEQLFIQLVFRQIDVSWQSAYINRCQLCLNEWLRVIDKLLLHLCMSIIYPGKRHLLL